MSDIKITDVTEGNIEGSGAFDKLQQAFSAHLLQEYKKNRIKGTEYSEVYLGGMQSAMQQAIAFVLGEESAGYQADLLAAQVVTEGLNQTKVRAEIAHIHQQTELAKAQTIKVDTEIQVLEKNIEEAEAKIWVTRAQVRDNLSLDTPPTDLTKGILGRQAGKITAETGLLNQKKTSEQAQTSNGVAGSESVLGKEILLRQRQADGFLRDAEQKLSKIVTDAFSVQFSTLDGFDEQPIPSSFQSGGVDSVILKARTGIGA